MSNQRLSKIIMSIMVAKGRKSLNHLEASGHNAMRENQALLMRILHDNKNTEFGKAHRFADIHSVEDFRREVPMSAYEDYASYIERMKNGEINILTAEKILGYSRTSGSSGVPKYIPATSTSLNAYVKYTWTRALALAADRLKEQGKTYKPGRGVFLSPATNECLPNGVICSNIAEIGALQYGTVYPFILTIPDRNLFSMEDGDYIYNIYRFALADEDVTFLFSVFFSINVSQFAYMKENWQLIVDDIEKGTINESIDMKPELRAKLLKKIRPMPHRAAYLRRQFEQGFDSTLFKRIWPNLSVICGIGNASFKPAADYIRRFAEGIPFDYSIYGASEGLVAACNQLDSTNMQLLTDSCFYEFIPVEALDDNIVFTLDQLKEGEKYEILITTAAGLYRYRLKDVIQVNGFRGQCPMISFVYRKGQMFNIAGEKFSEEDARKTMEMFEKAHGISVENWIFYQDESVIPNRYCLAVETDANLDGDDIIDEIEDYLGQCNKRYTSQRQKKFIGRLIVRKQIPGTHNEWKDKCVSQGAFAVQVKPVHSLDNEEKKDFFLSRLK